MRPLRRHPSTRDTSHIIPEIVDPNTLEPLPHGAAGELVFTSLTIEERLGVSAKVKLVEPKTIQRSEGKAVRVVDNP